MVTSDPSTTMAVSSGAAGVGRDCQKYRLLPTSRMAMKVACSSQSQANGPCIE